MDNGSPGGARDARIGTRIGNYTIRRKLGEGGMGSVYLAEHDTLPDTFVAVKVLNLDIGGDGASQMAERFRQEALVAAKIGSHRVVKPSDVGRFDDGAPYIVMEFVAGRTLTALLRAEGPLPVETALKIAYRVADTLALAHQKGIVHRDVKPDNIMLSEFGDVKLADFGVARASGSLKLVQTSHQAVIGTPGYMSPEAATANGTDGRTDVFLLGVVLFQMLTAELPFPAPTVTAAVTNVLTLPAPRVGARRRTDLPPVPEAVEAVLARALVKDPQDRCKMAELGRALLDALVQVTAGGGERGAMATYLSMVAPIDVPAHETPTLSERTVEVGALLRRLTPVRGAAGDRLTREEGRAAASATPADLEVQQAPSLRAAMRASRVGSVAVAPERARRAWWLWSAAAVLLGVVAATAVYFLRGRPAAPVATESADSPGTRKPAPPAVETTAPTMSPIAPPTQPAAASTPAAASPTMHPAGRVKAKPASPTSRKRAVGEELGTTSEEGPMRKE